MGVLPVKCAIKYNRGGSSVYAWFGIKAVFVIGTMMMIMIVFSTLVCTESDIMED